VKLQTLKITKDHKGINKNNKRNEKEISSIKWNKKRDHMGKKKRLDKSSEGVLKSNVNVRIK
jgi:hypothetical protein